MRTMACCLLMMSLVGCQSGPRWLMRDHSVSGNASYSDDLPADSAGRSEFDDSGIPPSPAQRPSDYEQSTRSKKSAGANQQAARTKSASNKRKLNAPTTSRATQLAGKKPAASARPSAQDETVKQLMADLEKTKREKSSLQSKLSEETARQTQQRLELEARMAVLQEQLRQQSALQQVAYQQQAQAIARPSTNYGQPMAQNYNGPVITSGAPSPSMSSPQPTNNFNGYGSNGPSVPAWNNTPSSNWNSPAPAWNTPAAPASSQVEMWQYSPQRR